MIYMDIAVCGALNLETVDENSCQLVGGAYYSAFSIARYIKNICLIGCIGTDADEGCLKTLHDCAFLEDVNLKLSYFNGKNFRHHINTNTMNDIKDFGDYKDFFFDGNTYRTNYLVLASGSPKLHKSALACCDYYDCLVLDSKLIYYQTAIMDVADLFYKCNIYSANTEEMALLLKHMNANWPYDLFEINHNLKFVIHHCHSLGGTLYDVDGVGIQWEIRPAEREMKNDVGAGDIFLGTFLGSYIKTGNLKTAIQDAAVVSYESVAKIGMAKTASFTEYQYIAKNIKLNFIDWRVGYVKN